MTKLPLIRQHYLRTWFAVDLCSMLPFDLFAQLGVMGVESSLLRLVRTVRLLVRTPHREGAPVERVDGWSHGAAKGGIPWGCEARGPMGCEGWAMGLPRVDACGAPEDRASRLRGWGC